VAGGTLQTAVVPANTDITNSGPITATSSLAGVGGGQASLTVTNSQAAIGTTCELVAGASFSTLPSQVAFNAQESGAELVTFRSTARIGGVLVAEAEFVPSTGPAIGTGTLTADFAFDGSIDMVAPFGGVARHGRPCVLGPGQDYVVHVVHSGALAGPQVGSYASRITLRFVPHADGFSFYGPTSGCRHAWVLWSMTGGSLLFHEPASPPADLHVIAIGNSQVATPFPLPSSCPLLSSADILIAGPFTTPWYPLPFHTIPSGASVYLQFVGLRLATLTAEPSIGIHGFGQ
jgi:hypothetical protein